MQRIEGRLEVALIIVDPLRNHLAGDENSATDVLEALHCLSAMRTHCSCPLVVSHHLNRAGSMSGSRALLGRVDLAFTGSDEEQPWYSTIGRTVRRSDPIADRWTVRIDHEHDDDDTQARTVLVSRFANEAKGVSQHSKLARQVFDELSRSGEPLTVNMLKTRLKRSYAHVSQALNELQSADRVTKSADGWSVSAECFFSNLVGGEHEPK